MMLFLSGGIAHLALVPPRVSRCVVLTFFFSLPDIPPSASFDECR